MTNTLPRNDSGTPRPHPDDPDNTALLDTSHHNNISHKIAIGTLNHEANERFWSLNESES